MAKMNQGGRLVGGLTVLFGAAAFATNSIIVVISRDGFLPSPIAGGTGVVATLLLALCLFSVADDS